jgi:hypothetical protein
MRLVAFLATAATVAVAAPLGLYGIQDNGSSSAGALSLIDVTTGAIASIGEGLPMEAVAQEVSTIDGSSEVYYVIGYNMSSYSPNVVGISLATGSVLSSAPISFTEQGFIGVGQNIAWAPDTNAIIASGQNAKGDHLYGYVDPVSGNFTQRAIVQCGDKCDDVMAGPADYAPDTHVFVAQLGTLGSDPAIDFIAVNMSSGKPAPKPDCGGLETLDYDRKSGSFYGIGLQVRFSRRSMLGLASFESVTAACLAQVSPTVQRTLVKMTPDASSCSVVGIIPDYFMIGAGVSAIDETAGILYWISGELPSSC